MTERLLQFIWKMQYFNKTELQTTSLEELTIIHPGQFNTNQGPDFLEATIKIDDTIWAGHVELHVNASDWHLHHHAADSNYRNVILHVVWKNDYPDNQEAENNIPVLVLEGRVSRLLLDRYHNLMSAQTHIACSGSIDTIPGIVWESWKDRLISERLLRKADLISTHLKQSKGHWEEIFWWWIARNFGMEVNKEAFETIARTLPIKILAKHKNQIHQLESFLFGQAGLLNERFREDYPLMLQKEYRFFKKKYQFAPSFESIYFLRMRPVNFPTVRLAQLAMLIHTSSHLFDKIKTADDLTRVRNMLAVTANDYWHYHYRFNEVSPFLEKKVGKQMTENIIINTVVPVLFAYGHLKQEHQYTDKALRWLEETAPEKNNITRQWTKLGLTVGSAFDSQAYIELYKNYCTDKRCLQCVIGNYSAIRNF